FRSGRAVLAQPPEPELDRRVRLPDLIEFLDHPLELRIVQKRHALDGDRVDLRELLGHLDGQRLARGGELFLLHDPAPDRVALQALHHERLAAGEIGDVPVRLRHLDSRRVRRLEHRELVGQRERVTVDPASGRAADERSDALIGELQQEARETGLWAPHLPPEAGGSGSGFIEYAYLNEEIGRSFIAQLIFGCQAPDAGNGEILHLYGTPEQKQRFLEPLVAGDTRSFFGMTEPEVAGSDPTLLQGRAVRDGDEWVINAHKWFSSGADGAGFGIVMVVTDPDAEPHRRASMILVPTDTPGYELVRRVSVMGHAGRGWGTHCETRFTGARVPLANPLGAPG